MPVSMLTKCKLCFFKIPDSRLKRFCIWLHEQWMEVYDPLRTKILYNLLHRKIERNYEHTLERLRKAKKIRVLFLIKENEKWGWNSLYRAFEDDPVYEPMVAVIFFGLPKTPDAIQKKSFEENYDFFKSRGMRVVKAYDEQTDQFIDLRRFSPDIVFYEPPWHLPKIHDIQEVSKFALTCYTPYGVKIAKNTAHYRLLFLQLVWRHFVEGELSKKYIASGSINKGVNVVATGYPKLDVYLGKREVTEGSFWTVPSGTEKKKRIIYAPHWSFSLLRYATFDWSGDFLLSYAKANAETEWVFKPHPRLRHTLFSELSWTKERIDKYFRAWIDLPNTTTYAEGDYFDLFMSSDALITDCGSFLAEYLYTRKPIILLVNPQSVGYNDIGKLIVKDYYKAHDQKELEQLIKHVILQGNDELYNKRMKALDVIPLPSTGAGHAIKSYIESEIGIRKRSNDDCRVYSGSI